MSAVWNTPGIISPSLISCMDMCNLESQIKLMEKENVPLLHIDILDGHFSPSMPLGLDTVRQLKKKTDIPFDVHVMTKNNQFFISELIDMKVEQIVFHLETEDHPDGMLNTIKDANIRAGIALKPGTPVSSLEYLINKCDTVLLMLINPGYASSTAETQVSYATEKIDELHKLITTKKVSTKIELDGRISTENIKDYIDIADIFVTGSTCIDRNDLRESIKKLMLLKNKLTGDKIK